MHHIDDGEESYFQLPYGEWIRLFRANGFVVEDLIEPRPPEGATSSYRNPDEIAWARRWPAEEIWRLRRGRDGEPVDSSISRTRGSPGPCSRSSARRTRSRPS